MQSKSQANLLELAFTSTSTKSPSGTGIESVSELGFARRIKQRAEILGIKETRFFWIAEESLNVPLEVNLPWEQGINEDGIPFYYNHETEESVWEHPALAPHREIYELEKEKYRQQQLQEARDENEKEAQLLNDLNSKISEIKDADGGDRDLLSAAMMGNSSHLGPICESEHSIASSSSSESEDTDVQLEKIVGNSKLVKELQEQYREEDVAYWRSQYDELLQEVRRIYISTCLLILLSMSVIVSYSVIAISIVFM